MIGIWLIFGFYIIVHYVTLKNYKELISTLIKFFTGVLIFTIPLFLYLIYKGIFY